MQCFKNSRLWKKTPTILLKNKTNKTKSKKQKQNRTKQSTHNFVKLGTPFRAIITCTWIYCCQVICISMLWEKMITKSLWLLEISSFLGSWNILLFYIILHNNYWLVRNFVITTHFLHVYHYDFISDKLSAFIFRDVIGYLKQFFKRILIFGKKQTNKQTHKKKQNMKKQFKYVSSRLFDDLPKK